jgi:hypothetical protein
MPGRLMKPGNDVWSCRAFAYLGGVSRCVSWSVSRRSSGFERLLEFVARR